MLIRADEEHRATQAVPQVGAVQVDDGQRDAVPFGRRVKTGRGLARGDGPSFDEYETQTFPEFVVERDALSQPDMGQAVAGTARTFRHRRHDDGRVGVIGFKDQAEGVELGVFGFLHPTVGDRAPGRGFRMEMGRGAGEEDQSVALRVGQLHPGRPGAMDRSSTPVATPVAARIQSRPRRGPVSWFRPKATHHQAPERSSGPRLPGASVLAVQY
ncbi:hypothetical protein QA861_29275 [Streptomyces sp. B21-083]